jgi:hypothetical protein
MRSEAEFNERRDHPRAGLMAELENITYSILRKHGVDSETLGPAHAVKPVAQ